MTPASPLLMSAPQSRLRRSCSMDFKQGAIAKNFWYNILTMFELFIIWKCQPFLNTLIQEMAITYIWAPRLWKWLNFLYFNAMRFHFMMTHFYANFSSRVVNFSTFLSIILRKNETAEIATTRNEMDTGQYHLYSIQIMN